MITFSCICLFLNLAAAIWSLLLAFKNFDSFPKLFLVNSLCFILAMMSSGYCVAILIQQIMAKFSC